MEYQKVIDCECAPKQSLLVGFAQVMYKHSIQAGSIPAVSTKYWESPTITERSSSERCSKVADRNEFRSGWIGMKLGLPVKSNRIF